MITLCERCFSKWRDAEVLTVTPLLPCEHCGAAGPDRHVLRTDPHQRPCKECGRKEGDGHYDDCPVGMAGA